MPQRLFGIGNVLCWQSSPAVDIWFPPSTPQGRRRKPWPMAGDCAICGWRWERLGDFAPCAARPKALPLETAIWAVRRPLARVVGERFFVRTRCGFAAIRMYGKKPQRSPGGKDPASTADTRAVDSPHKKKSSKTFIFGVSRLSPLPYKGISLESTSVKYSGSSQHTVTGSSVRGCRNVNSRAWRHWLSMPSSGFLWP